MWTNGLQQKETRRQKKNRKKNKDMIIWCWKSQAHSIEQDSFLFNKPPPPDCCNRPNISKPFNPRNDLENRQWSQPRELSSFFICFLFTLFCVCQRDRRETPTARLPGRGRAQWRMSAAGLLSPDLLPGLIRTDPCWLPPLSEGRGKDTEGRRGKNINTKAEDEVVKEWQENSNINIKGEKSTILVTDWGTPPPPVWFIIRKRARPRQPFHLKPSLTPSPLVLKLLSGL